MPPKKSARAISLEEQVDTAFLELSLDANKMINPIPQHTSGLRKICMLVNLALPITKLLMGVIHIHQCPTNDWLPIYMIVGGVIQMVFLILLSFKTFRQPAALFLVGFALFVWLLISSVNIIIEWKPNFFLGGWRYCHKAFFYFTFYLSIFEYLVFAIILLYVCTQFSFERVQKKLDVDTV